ncbi:MAG: hypothetical protein K0R34_2153 [Herbinix sp.]|nr:hypothetical protein [Herbinix sp.]
MKVNVLGTEYTINKYNYKDKPEFEKGKIDGYCDRVLKEIAYADMTTYPGYENETKESCNIVEKQVIRHEIVHAFLSESGLQDNAGQPVGAWCANEEMVDWIALQFPKMLKAFQEVGCL